MDKHTFQELNCSKLISFENFINAQKDEMDVSQETVNGNDDIIKVTEIISLNADVDVDAVADADVDHVEGQVTLEAGNDEEMVAEISPSCDDSVSSNDNIESKIPEDVLDSSGWFGSSSSIFGSTSWITSFCWYLHATRFDLLSERRL